VDGDGKLDIIFSVAQLLNTSIDDLFHDNASQRSFAELCHQHGQYARCMCSASADALSTIPGIKCLEVDFYVNNLDPLQVTAD